MDDDQLFLSTLEELIEQGSYAEKVSGSDLVLVSKPTELDFHEAAALPLAGTAALDLLEAVDVREGDT
jgi:NADPH:quinone reductase-like Zn-dependent oxidoreductase